MPKPLPECGKPVPLWPDDRRKPLGVACIRPKWHDGQCSDRLTQHDITAQAELTATRTVEQQRQYDDNQKRKNWAKDSRKQLVKEREQARKKAARTRGQPIPLCKRRVRETQCPCILPEGHYGIHLCLHNMGMDRVR